MSQGQSTPRRGNQEGVLKTQKQQPREKREGREASSQEIRSSCRGRRMTRDECREDIR